MTSGKTPLPGPKRRIIQKTILDNRRNTARQIRNTLAQQGITISEAAIKQIRSRMKRNGIPSGKIFKTELCRQILRKNPSLPNAEVAQMLKSQGVSIQNVRDARRQLKQNAPRTARAKPYPRLTKEHLRLIEKGLPILKRLVWVKTALRGRIMDYATEAFLELSAQLPHWIVQKRPGASLEAFLDFKTSLALKDFRIKTIRQGTGLKQIEIKQGLRWLRAFERGDSYEQIARKNGVKLKEVKEITDALKMFFNTASTDKLKPIKRKSTDT